MSDALVGALIGALAALAGTTLTFTLEWFRRGRERSDDALDALRDQRAAAYRAYVRQVHLAAHHMALSSADSGHPKEREDAAAMVNREVAGALLELEVLAPEETLAVARALRDVLREFRTIVQGGGISTSDEWAEILTRYRAIRQSFLDRARLEILR